MAAAAAHTPRHLPVPAGLRDTMQAGRGHEQLPGLAGIIGGFPGLSAMPAMPAMQTPLLGAQAAYLRSLQERLAQIVAASTASSSVYHDMAWAPNLNYPALDGTNSFDAANVLYHTPDNNTSLSIASLLSARDPSPAHDAAAALVHAAAAQAKLYSMPLVPASTTNSSPPISASAIKIQAKSSHRKDSAAEGKELASTKQAGQDEIMSDDSSATAATRANSMAPGTERGPRKQIGRRSQWSAEEHQRFLSGLARFGPKDAGTGQRLCNEPGARISVGLGPGVAEVIAVVVGTRTVSQVRSHAQKYFLRQTRKNVV